MEAPGISIPASPTPATPKYRWPRFVYSVRLHTHFYGMLLKRAVGLWRPIPVDAARLAQGVTFVLPGVEGESPYCHGMCNGLKDADIPGAVIIYDWAIAFPIGFFPNLMNLRRNRLKAAELTDMILRYQARHPGRPVHLVANSGGAFIALMAVAALPEDHPIDGIALLGGAVSCDYDLSEALQRTKKGIINSYSDRDWLVLGWGTSLFGTSDRKSTHSCGFKGFREPASAGEDDPRTKLYRKLQQIPWRPDMCEDCEHWGTHLTSSSRKFVKKYIAPWIAEAPENS